MDNNYSIFHIKIPSLSNLQLIRSLILTTLITALLSLFFNSLYYSICRWAYHYRKKNRIPYREAKKLSQKTRDVIRNRVRFYKRLLILVALCIIIVIIACSVVVLKDTSVLLPLSIFEWVWAIVIISILLLIVAIYFAYRYVRNPLVNINANDDKDGYSEQKLESYTIFVHERNEDEEYDHLVEEMYEESKMKQQDDGSNDNELDEEDIIEQKLT